MRRNLLLLLALVACGGDDKKTPDAMPRIDAAVDAASPAVTCENYCTTIASTCTGANAQFGGSSADDAKAHCMGTCATFDPSTSQSGATLGCHLYHVNNAKNTNDLAIHCPHAGPAGDKIGSAGLCGDACTNFCNIEIATCGLKGAQGNANGQYTSMAECMTSCAAFNATASYTVDATTFPSKNPTGDTLACRLYHATNAAVSAANATTHCPHTATVSAVCKAP